MKLTVVLQVQDKKILLLTLSIWSLLELISIMFLRDGWIKYPFVFMGKDKMFMYEWDIKALNIHSDWT